MRPPEISRARPAYVVILIDQSRSMGERYAGTDESKAELVARLVNQTIESILVDCTAMDEVRDYFNLSVLGYGNPEIANALGGELVDEPVVTPSQLRAAPLRTETHRSLQPDGWGGMAELEIRRSFWVEPVVGHWTPTADALRRAHELVTAWARQHLGSYPPIVLHITDGVATGDDPEPAANELCAVSTNHGPTMLHNCHVTVKQAKAVAYPVNEWEAPGDVHARRLFRMSSPLRDDMILTGCELAHDLRPGARGYVYNGGLDELSLFLSIGTAVTRVNPPETAARAAAPDVDFR